MILASFTELPQPDGVAVSSTQRAFAR